MQVPGTCRAQSGGLAASGGGEAGAAYPELPLTRIQNRVTASHSCQNTATGFGERKKHMRRGRDRDHARHHSQTGHSDNAARSPVQRGHRPGCCSQRTSGPDRAGQEDHARAAALKPPPPPPPQGVREERPL